MAAHSSLLAWRIPWTEEPGGLQSMGSQGVRHDWVTEHTCPGLAGAGLRWDTWDAQSTCISWHHLQERVPPQVLCTKTGVCLGGWPNTSVGPAAPLAPLDMWAASAQQLGPLVGTFNHRWVKLQSLVYHQLLPKTGLITGLHDTSNNKALCTYPSELSPTFWTVNSLLWDNY